MEQKITTVIEQAKTSMQVPQKLSPNLTQRLNKIRDLYPSFKAFATRFNPQTQVDFAEDVRKTIEGDYSTLEMLDMAIGENTSAKWLTVSITEINVFCGSKSMTKEQIKSLARLIVKEYKDIKISVMQLFFYKFKCGDFGKFYGKVDPMVITCALKDFIAECEKQHQKYLEETYQAKQQQEIELRSRLYKAWFDMEQELIAAVPAADKPVLSGIYIDVIDVENRCIRLCATKKQHKLLEDTHFNLFQSKVLHYFPGYYFCYRFVKDRNPVEEKERVYSVSAIKTICSSAQSIIDNTYAFGEASLRYLRVYFEKKYGCSPEDYLRRHAGK